MLLSSRGKLGPARGMLTILYSGWKTLISYNADPQEWENYHVDDYAKVSVCSKR